ncbi:MAG: hypothetical protein LDL44_10635, partial [Caenispirillum sp.]|nr:hypothetical protein [Caenispirillum sp.]
MPDAALLPVDAPFPLQRRFRRRILPGLLVFVLMLAVLAALGGRRLVEGIYLDLAQARAEAIAALVERETPDGWAARWKPPRRWESTSGRAAWWRRVRRR